MPRHPLSRVQLRQIHQARRWSDLWKADPAKMEACRRAATVAAAKAKEQKNDRLRAIVAQWPLVISPSDLKGLVLELADRRSPYRSRRRLNPKSVLNRLRRCSMLAFDHATGAWQNLCRSSVENGEGPGTT